MITGSGSPERQTCLTLFRKCVNITSMETLIQALRVLQKYGENPYPTRCEHDVLYLMMPIGALPTDEDIALMSNYHFEWDEEEERFFSYWYGSN